MFILKYSKPGFKTKYGAGNRLVSDKRYAVAYGEGFRGLFEKFAEGHSSCSLATIQVSDTAEMMYRDTTVRVKDIVW